MGDTVKGLHHITAIAGDAQKNLDFYKNILGLRFVKKTVNFDDPGTYHFYFGNEKGEPGTILTFFPWQNIPRGTKGAGQATETMFSVPPGSLEFWKNRFEKENIIYNNPSTRFNETYLVFEDPDGLKLALVANDDDNRTPWITGDISEENALRGFYGTALTLSTYEATATVLTDLLGYEHLETHVNRHRYMSKNSANAAVIDLVHLPDENAAGMGSGTVHHIAFSVKDTATQMNVRKKIEAHGLHITPQIDRDYFKSLYFREPGGVLFEIATEDPGFTADEALENLGRDLKLPAQHEHLRSELEKRLPQLTY